MAIESVSTDNVEAAMILAPAALVSRITVSSAEQQAEFLALTFKAIRKAYKSTHDD